jgi:hypothetical protein
LEGPQKPNDFKGLALSSYKHPDKRNDHHNEANNPHGDKRPQSYNSSFFHYIFLRIKMKAMPKMIAARIRINYSRDTRARGTGKRHNRLGLKQGE